MSALLFLSRSLCRTRAVASFDLDTRVWIIEEIFLFRVVVRRRRSRHFRRLVVRHDYLVDVAGLVGLEGPLSDAEFRKDAHTASIQAEYHKVHYEHSEHTGNAHNNRFAWFTPVEQTIYCGRFRSAIKLRHFF